MMTTNTADIGDAEIICEDCMEPLTEDTRYGDPVWSEPRCEACYEAHRYDRGA